MGMITRVRGRLRSLHTLPKLDEKVRDEKIAETVCLLSVLFLLPYCARGHAQLLVSLGSWFLTTYSFLVLPILISANYKYPVRWLRQIIRKLPGMAKKYSRPTWNLICKVYAPIDRCEKSFMKMKNISNLATQISFFLLCEQQMDRPDLPDLSADKNIVVALTTVLFYSVVGYFATRVRDIYQGNRNRLATTTPSFTNYLKWLCKIILEWAKAVVVVLCLREQGIQYEPKLAYSLITFIYYLCTEKIFVEIFPQLVEALKIDKLENLEHLYVPLFMNALAIGSGLIVGLYSLYVNYSNFILLSLYFMVYLRMKDAYYNYWELLVTERDTYSSFQVATRQDIEDWDDICAVCLNTMSRARITPCNHLFHPYCLKQCLRNSFYCPLCKRNFLETRMFVK